MRDEISSSNKEHSGRLRERLYWLVVGVLTASIVWLTVGNTMWSNGSEPTTALEDVPSPSASTDSGTVETPSMDGMSHSGDPSLSDEPSASDEPSVSESEAPSEEPSVSASAAPSQEQDATANGGVSVGTLSTDPLTACRAVYEAQQQPLQDAAPAMDQWEVHVGAMNKLVVGAITLAQATQFWNQTRVGAMAHLDAFAKSDGQYLQRTTRCAPPATRRPSGDKLDACQRSVAARSRVLHLAREALATWRMHVMHMEMLRDGKMSPARATTLWLHSWRAGQAQIDQYRSALAAARGARC